MAQQEQECCPPFDPETWDEKEVTWEGKQFVQDRVRSFLHIPLNFGGVMKRSVERIEAAGAKPERMMTLCDDNSLWGCDVYLDVTGDVPGARTTTLSGTFLSKVFEGPYSKVHGWCKEMTAYVQSKNRQPKRTLYYYTTCPKCAKRVGKNYVVLLAEV